MRFVVGAIIWTTSFAAFGQTSGDAGETRSSIEIENVSESVDSRHQLALDFVPTLVASGARGLGASYHYGVLPRLSLGAFGSYYQTDKFNTESYRDIDWVVSSAGVESKFFLTDFGQGLYLGMAATYVYIKGEGTVREFGGSAFAAVEDDADAFGYLAKLGYGFAGNKMKSGAQFVIDVALSYGTGNSFEYSTISSGGIGSLRVRSVNESLGFYGGLGILF